MTQGSALNFACISLKFSPSQRAGMGSPAAGPGTHCRHGSQGGHRCVEAKRRAAGPCRSPQEQCGSGESLCHNTFCRQHGLNHPATGCMVLHPNVHHGTWTACAAACPRERLCHKATTQHLCHRVLGCHGTVTARLLQGSHRQLQAR